MFNRYVCIKYNTSIATFKDTHKGFRNLNKF